jgi:hypothetical protein
VERSASVVAPIGAGYVVNRRSLQVVFYREMLRRIRWGTALSTVGWAMARIHLLLFDALFLRQAKGTGLPRRGSPLSRAEDGNLQSRFLPAPPAA